MSQLLVGDVADLLRFEGGLASLLDVHECELLGCAGYDSLLALLPQALLHGAEHAARVEELERQAGLLGHGEFLPRRLAAIEAEVL